MLSSMEPTSASADQLTGRELPRAILTSFASLIISSRASEMLVTVPSETDSLAYKIDYSTGTWHVNFIQVIRIMLLAFNQTDMKDSKLAGGKKLHDSL